MGARGRSRVAALAIGLNDGRYRNHLNSFSGLYRTALVVRSLLSFALLIIVVSLLPFFVAAQTRELAANPVLQGDILTTQGRPVPNVAVELHNLRGDKVGSGTTDAAGHFAIAGDLSYGEYVLVAARSFSLKDERLTLDRPDLQYNMALPELGNLPIPSKDVVSVQKLRVPNSAWVHLEKAKEHFRRSNFEAAVSEVGRALQSAPSCAQAFTLRGLIALATGDRSAAIENAKQALTVDPEEDGAFLVLATAYNSLHEFSLAETSATRALALNPESWQARLEFAKSLYGQDRPVVAYRELGLLKQDFPDVHLVRGNVLLRLNRRAEAGKEFATFLRQLPNDPRGGSLRPIIARLQADSSAAIDSPARGCTEGCGPAKNRSE